MGIPVPFERLETHLPNLSTRKSGDNSPSPHGREISFSAAGLVDHTALLEYVHTCHCHELSVPRDPSTHASEFHHIYFPRPLYDTREAHTLHKKLHRHKYNQIEMLSCQEDLYHQKHSEVVPNREIDLYAARHFLEDARKLDTYAATSFRIAETRQQIDSPEITKSEKSRLVARLALLHEFNTESRKQIDTIALIPEVVVLGALQQYSRRQPEESLTDLLVNSPAIDQKLLTPKIQSTYELRKIADGQLLEKVLAMNWSLRRLLLPENSKHLYEQRVEKTAAV